MRLAYRRYYGTAVTQGERHSVTFRREDAERRFLTANEPMWAFFEPELRRRLSELEADASTGDRVHAALLEMLPAGEASVEAVAKRLMVSSRTLQRRLRDAGTSYQVVLDESRSVGPPLPVELEPACSRVLLPARVRRPQLLLPGLPRLDRRDARTRPHRSHPLGRLPPGLGATSVTTISPSVTAVASASTSRSLEPWLTRIGSSRAMMTGSRSGGPGAV